MRGRSFAVAAAAVVTRCAFARALPRVQGSKRLLHVSSAAFRRKRAPPQEQQHMSEEDGLGEEEAEMLRRMSPEERAYLKLSVEQMEHYFKVAKHVNEGQAQQQEVEREEQQKRRQRRKRKQKDQLSKAGASSHAPSVHGEEGDTGASADADIATGTFRTQLDSPDGAPHMRMGIPDVLSRKDLPRMDLSRPTGTSFLESKQAAIGISPRVEVVDDFDEEPVDSTNDQKQTEDGPSSHATGLQGTQSPLRSQAQPVPEEAQHVQPGPVDAGALFSTRRPRTSPLEAATAIASTTPVGPAGGGALAGSHAQRQATRGHDARQGETGAAGVESRAVHDTEDEDLDEDDDDDDDDDMLEEVLMRGDAGGTAEVPIKEVTFSLGKPRHQRRTKDERWEGSARHRRVADAISAAIEAAVYQHHLDPLFVRANLTIYDVDVKRSFRAATVYWTAAFSQDPDVQQQQEAAITEALELYAKGFRRSVARKLRIKHTPRLLFRHSMVDEEEARLEALLREGLGREPRPVHLVMQEAQEAATTATARGRANANATTPQRGSDA